MIADEGSLGAVHVNNTEASPAVPDKEVGATGTDSVTVVEVVAAIVEAVSAM